MKYTVYVLKYKFGKFYKGMTGNLTNRLRDHRSGHTITTSKMTDLEIVYSEEFLDFDKARKRELYFKSAAGRRFIKAKLLGL